MKTPITQEEIDAAETRWEVHAARHVARGSGHDTGATWFWIFLVVFVCLGVPLFLPTDRASYDSALAWGRKTANYLIYRVPCMAPESSFIGKWVRGKQVDCAKL